MIRGSIVWAVAIPMLIATSGFAAERSGAFLGIHGESNGADAARKGAVVLHLVEDGPAAAAGLMKGDLIVRVGDVDITDYAHLAKMLGSHKSGDKIQLTVWRDDAEMTMTVELGERPDMPKRPFGLDRRDLPFAVPGGESILPKHFAESFKKRPMIGVDLQGKIEDSLRDRLGLGDHRGVLIADIVADGPAAKAGVESSDLITEVDGEPVEKPRDMVDRIAAKKAGDKVVLKIWRDGESLEKTIVLEAMRPAFGSRAAPMPHGFDPESLHRMLPHGAAKLAEMQKRIDELEKKVEALSDKLEKLNSKPVREKKGDSVEGTEKNAA